MNTRPMLTADDVKRIAAAAEREALSNGWAVTIAICDDGGHLLALQRLDGAAPISAQIASHKARTAAIFVVWRRSARTGTSVSTRPGSRVVISWSSQRLPSESSNDA